MGSIVEQKKTGKDGKEVVTYRAHVRRTGFASKSKVFKNKSDAKRWLQDNEAEVTLKRTGLGKPFVDLLDDFVALAGCSYARQAQLDFWREYFYDANVAEIKHGDIAGGILKLRQKTQLRSSPIGNLKTDKPLSNGTINRYAATLSAVFSFALEHGLIEHHPMKGGKVKKLKEGIGRQRVLTEAEEDELMKAAKNSSWPLMWLFLRMLLTTGARRSEVNNLRWSDLRLEDSVAILAKTKNGHARALPLVSDVKAALAAASKVRPLHSDYVFFDPKKPDRPKPIEAVWKTCRTEAKLDNSDVVIHTTRHSAITKLVKGGANLAQVAVVSGHKTLAMLKRYEHLAAQDSVDLAERLLAGKKQG